MYYSDFSIDQLKGRLREKAFHDSTPKKYAGDMLEALEVIQQLQKASRELAQAEQEGRLVVLPCKVGDTTWVKDRSGQLHEMRLETPDIRFVCTDEDNLCMALCNRKPNGFCAYRIKNDGSDVGKEVFLTREEAEAAVEKQKNTICKEE